MVVDSFSLNKTIIILLVGIIAGISSFYKPLLISFALVPLLFSFVVFKKQYKYMFYLSPILLIAFVPTYYVSIFNVFGGVKPSLIGLFILASLLVLTNKKTKLTVIKDNKLLLIFLWLLCFSYFLSVWGSGDYQIGSRNYALAFNQSFIMITATLVGFLINTKVESLIVFKGIAIISLIVSFIGVLEILNIQPYLPLYLLDNQTFLYNVHSETSIFRIVSSIGNPLVLSSFLVFCLPFIYYLLDKERKMIWILSLILTLSAIVFTFSRSALIIAVVISVIMLMKFSLKRFINITVFSVGTATLIGFVLLSSGEQSFAIERLTFQSQAESFSYRIEAFSAISNIINNSPFLGLGVGNVNSYLLSYNGLLVSHNTLDNLFLDIIASNGLFGIGLLTVCLFLIFINLFNKNFSERKVLLSLLLAFGGMGLSFDLAHYDVTWLFFWFGSGFLLSQKNRSNNYAIA